MPWAPLWRGLCFGIRLPASEKEAQRPLRQSPRGVITSQHATASDQRLSRAVVGGGATDATKRLRSMCSRRCAAIRSAAACSPIVTAESAVCRLSRVPSRLTSRHNTEMTHFTQRRSHATLVAIDQNGSSPCVGTRGHHRRYAQAVAAAEPTATAPLRWLPFLAPETRGRRAGGRCLCASGL